MGTWSYKILGNDSSEEIREIFIQLYNSNLDVESIKSKVTKEQEGIFNSDPYNALFGYAMVCWECKCLDKELLQRVKNIVQSGQDLQFNRELDATKEFLTKRKNELIRFLNKISVPKTKARKRVKPPKLYNFKFSQGDIWKISLRKKYEIIILIVESKHYKNKGEFSYINLFGTEKNDIQELSIPTNSYLTENHEWSPTIFGGHSYWITYEKDDKENLLKIISKFEKVDALPNLDFGRLTYSTTWSPVDFESSKTFNKLLIERWIKDTTSIDYRTTKISELIEQLNLKAPTKIS